ncbi:MAG TPA: hypothetical protein VIO15_00320 [Bacteroidales bacterium]
MAVAAIAFINQNANAQQTVQTGASVTYNTGGTGSSTFHWDVSGTVQSSNSDTMSYTWNTPGSYTVNVYGISSNSCNGPTRSLNVTVSNTLPVTLTMGAISSICPYQDTIQPTGGDPISTLTFTGATVGQTYSVAYTIYDGATVVSSNTVSGTLTTLTPIVTFDANIVNNSGANITREIRITSYTVNGVNYVPSTLPSQNVTIYSSPETSPISY